MAFLIFGDRILSALGVSATPDWLETLRSNRMLVFVALFLFNNIASGMASTGAFEVYLDGQLVHSKLATGGIVPIDQLVGMLRQRGLAVISVPGGS